jgi:hypothetical protein
LELPPELFLHPGRSDTLSNEEPASGYTGKSRSILQLFELTPEGEAPWDKSDLGRLIEQRLDMPLYELLPDVAQRATERRETALPGEDVYTLRELFLHAAPSLRLLEGAKRVFREWARGKERSTPAEVGTALYFITIALALVRGSKRITKLSNAELRDGLQATARHDWLPDSLREITNQCLPYCK